MEQAREAVSKFTGRKGHSTNVEETVRPAVTQETVKPHRHEESTKILDREVHQDHYHTTVQPLQHREVLPEKHTHQTAPVQERHFTHGDDSQTHGRLEQEAAQFQNTSTTQDTKHTQSRVNPTEGEHTHHHVHETVQPIINKETVAPEIIHTTQPIHETHHSDSQFHGASVLPTKSLNEFQNVPTGTTRREDYEGVPKSYNKSMQMDQTDADRFPDRKGVDGPGAHHTGGTGLADSQPFEDDAHFVSGSHRGTQSARTGRIQQDGQTTLPQSHHHDEESSVSKQNRPLGHVEEQKKPSLMEKINPKIDSNGDGKAGFMK